MLSSNCSFCGYKVYPGHGSIFVKNNLKIFFFCRSKCRKLFYLKKNPLFLKWTRSNRLSHGKIFKTKNGDFLKSCSEVYANYNKYLITTTIFRINRLKRQMANRSNDFRFLNNNKKSK
jgi:large subunit ribosomal protein L24e